MIVNGDNDEDEMLILRSGKKLPHCTVQIQGQFVYNTGEIQKFNMEKLINCKYVFMMAFLIVTVASLWIIPSPKFIEKFLSNTSQTDQSSNVIFDQQSLEIINQDNNPVDKHLLFAIHPRIKKDKIISKKSFNDTSFTEVPSLPESILTFFKNFILNLINRIASLNERFANILKRNDGSNQGLVPANQSSSFTNDHMEIDLKHIPFITAQQLMIAMAAFQSDAIQKDKDQLFRTANETDFLLSPHLAYRYYQSVDWSPSYNGKTVAEAMVATAQWRHRFGIHQIDALPFKQMLKSGFAYVAPSPDRFDRSIMYLKVGLHRKSDVIAVIPNEDEKFVLEFYMKLLMYTVERADRQSVAFGSGEFIAVVDFTNFTWNNCPPFSVVKEGINLMKLHYPYRLSGIFVINTSGPFLFLWQLMKPLLSKKALSKIYVLGSAKNNNVKDILEKKIGLSYLEHIYGGEKPLGWTSTSNSASNPDSCYFDNNTVNLYIENNYWVQKNRKIRR